MIKKPALRSRDSIEKLIVAQNVEELPALYGPLSFIAVFKTALPLDIS
jgi:hypothetical protein